MELLHTVQCPRYCMGYGSTITQNQSRQPIKTQKRLLPNSSLSGLILEDEDDAVLTRSLGSDKHLPSWRATFTSNNSPSSLLSASSSFRFDFVVSFVSLKNPTESLYISNTIPTCPPCSTVSTTVAKAPNITPKNAPHEPMKGNPWKIDPTAAKPVNKGPLTARTYSKSRVLI